MLTGLNIQVGYDHCIVGTYSNLDIIYPSTATDRQGCKKCTLVHFFRSYLATVSDRPPGEILETYPSIYASVKGTSPLLFPSCGGLVASS